MMTPFHQLVREMMEAQRQYFKTRTQEALSTSKALEKRVWDELRAFEAQEEARKMPAKKRWELCKKHFGDTQVLLFTDRYNYSAYFGDSTKFSTLVGGVGYFSNEGGVPKHTIDREVYHTRFEHLGLRIVTTDEVNRYIRDYQRQTTEATGVQTTLL